MKKQFSDPFIVQMNIADTQAGIVAAASSVPTPPTSVTENGDWKITCDYCNHNTGSHSEVKITMVYSGGKTGDDTLCMSFTMLNGFLLESVSNIGRGDVFATDVCEGGFKLVGTFHHNSSENVGFVLWIKVKNGPVNLETGHKGAAGKTGEYKPCDVKCISYTAL